MLQKKLAQIVCLGASGASHTKLLAHFSNWICRNKEASLLGVSEVEDRCYYCAQTTPTIVYIIYMHILYIKQKPFMDYKVFDS